MSLYDKVVGISKPYLGPAAEQFIGRQVRSHLKIEPAGLGPNHLKELAKWVQNSGSLIMDAAKATELAQKISAC